MSNLNNVFCNTNVEVEAQDHSLVSYNYDHGFLKCRKRRWEDMIKQRMICHSRLILTTRPLIA